MTDPIRNRIEFDAMTAASRAVMDWVDNNPRVDLVGCTPSMVAGTAVNAYRRSRDAACIITTIEQLDALPDGSIVRSADSAAWRKSGRYTPDEPWWCTGSDIESDSAGIVRPALLIWHPDWSQS